METTLEVRWFVKGTPSTAIQHWFEYECLGELLNNEPEIREDLYAYGNQLGDYDVRDEAVNLKLRQGNLELKLRDAKLGTYQFENARGYPVWSGNIERWTKFSQSQLNKSLTGVRDKIGWLRVNKKRSQRIHRDVKFELTYLRVYGDRWWSIAFEMPQNDGDINEQHLLQVIQQTAQSYPKLKLTADCSYSYSRWQTHFI